ncbi:MAG: phosphohydrolase, partial [Clostridia bacterium]|nr:phosphohydrolase [Clostridia bacterium]
HGDSVMVYFYDKAVKQAGEGVAVDESLFRYPSHKPTTKESAILMMADCCEAAVRSMVNPTMEDIRNKIIEVISHKWNKRDSMLWASPLTFAEIKKVEDCFLQTFTALYHERVEYPDLEEIDVR